MATIVETFGRRAATNGVTMKIAAALALAIAGCSPPPGSPDGGAADLATATDGGATGSGTVGAFQVRLIPPVAPSGMNPGSPGLTSLVGRVSDGPTPSLVILVEAAAEGACKLFKPKVPFCNTPCGGSAACVADDRCQPYPTAKSLGTVKVTGVKTDTGATEFSMEPVSNAYQPAAGVKLPFPAFAEGGAIRIASGGGAYAPFTIDGKGIAPLDLAKDAIKLEKDKAVTLRWTPPGQAGLARIFVKLDISHHGGSKGQIDCEADDGGSLVLPASLITQLLALGVAGFPSVIVERKAVSSTAIAPGRVELIVVSGAERFVDIPGLTSCNDDSQCPMGQKCQPDLTCK